MKKLLLTTMCIHSIMNSPKPCTDCARAIIQAGIKMVVTNRLPEDPNAPAGGWRDKLVYSEQMFKEAGVEYKILD